MFCDPIDSMAASVEIFCVCVAENELDIVVSVNL
jgi:hypothetical protein